VGGVAKGSMRGLGSACSRGSVLFSPLPYGAIEKGQDPLEVPVRRGGQDLSLLQTPASWCQPPQAFILQ
jgi:hypothetical protein